MRRAGRGGGIVGWFPRGVRGARGARRGVWRGRPTQRFLRRGEAVLELLSQLLGFGDLVDGEAGERVDHVSVVGAVDEAPALGVGVQHAGLAGA